MNDPARIHPTAVVDPGARLGGGVSVGAFTVIGAVAVSPVEFDSTAV